jgi:hypothetical protein
MSLIAQVTCWLNEVANALGRLLLAPIAVLPGWLSLSLVAVVTGIAMLWAFKYTSRQKAIRAVRNDIKAHLLALKLFKDSPSVTLRAQARVFGGAFRLMGLSIVPLLVMTIPMCLLLSQLALWYQARPLQIGEEAVVTVRLNHANPSLVQKLQWLPIDAVECNIGPIRVPSEDKVVLNLVARLNGIHPLTFDIDQQRVTKDLVIGEGLQRVSIERPEWHWTSILLHPAEHPFGPDSAFRSIEIEYPSRSSLLSGTSSWLPFWFITSMISAWLARPWLKVDI